MKQTTIAPADDLHHLLDDLVDRVSEAELAVLLSADGVALVASRTVTEEAATLVAAAAAGLHALAAAAGRQIHGGDALRTIVEMEHVLLVVEPAGDAALLAVTFTGAPDPEVVNEPVAETAERARRVLAARGRTGGEAR
ncbi:roadblock/LC7 domain-containing protein [Dactylosporangium roseum]|uniref:Roadblock/LC7 domain-containing protein n=1 Tax=Dactylosporangium roseum TaxID=47989 RepID=A0ABY5ZBN9_9ACTN|nr:roadblock/LC7 domain-containing protein [Dactylosporangium roseum]UWZ38872.1 roadblock/LC7 domain-containing protein [Dactylosporangium roseum]